MFDYSDLLGKIKAKYGTQSDFAEALGMSLSTLNQKLNNKSDWDTPEMVKACELLDIELADISQYFFKIKNC